MGMKTLDEICDEFEKNLKELGASAYIYSVKDPDCHSERWGTGLDMIWMLGVLQTLGWKVKKDFQDVNDNNE